MLDLEIRIKKAHVALMRHPETALYSGVMMAGSSSVSDEPITAATNGLDKFYGRAFMSKLSDQEINGIVLHENLHVALRHLVHNRDLFNEDKRTANIAADYVVNGIINGLKDTRLCKLPQGALYEPQYDGMSMREIYRLLRKNKKSQPQQPGQPCQNGQNGDPSNQSGQSQPGQSQPQSGKDDPSEYGGFDEHDLSSGPADAEELKKVSETVDRALREGALIAGRFGVDIPRAIGESLEPQVDWRAELMDFVVNATSGKDEYSWRRYNRRVIDTMLLPTTVNETIGEIVVAIDTSGSIGGSELGLFVSELVSICEMVTPERVRVLWWGTMVVGEQLFEGDYQNLKTLLKPRGGGGTRVGSVSDHIIKNNISADAVIVFTDGYVESPIDWRISIPSLWLVTQYDRMSVPVGGKLVKFNK